jgi:hypothetical protein
MKLSSMKSLAIAACMLPASFGLVAGQAIAADRNETVRFAAGASSASLSGSLTGYDSVNYRLGASAGQTMQVLLSPSHASCYFNVLPPGSDRAIFIGSTTGNEFAARLRQDGNYTVQVYQMRNAARRGTTCRYDISFEITGGNQAAMVPGDEMDGDDGEGALDGARFTRRDARQACVHRIHELYGIRRNAISDVSVTREGRDNFRLSGKVVRHQSLADTSPAGLPMARWSPFACTSLTSQKRQSARRCLARCCSAQPKPWQAMRPTTGLIRRIRTATRSPTSST